MLYLDQSSLKISSWKILLNSCDAFKLKYDSSLRLAQSGVRLSQESLLVSDWHSCHFPAQHLCCVNSKCTCAPLGALVLKWGLVRRTDGGLISWDSRTNKKTGLKSKSQFDCWCLTCIIQTVRCVCTGGFTLFIHSDFMTWEASFIFMDAGMSL